MSVIDAGHGQSALQPATIMFGLHSVLGLSQKTDPRQDSESSASSKLSLDGRSADLTSRSSSTLLFLSRNSKKIPADPSLELSCEAAIRPSFCWNSHQDTWQTGGVWSQFETGLKSCQDDVSACVNFMGDKDAALAGVFDGHGFNGRSAATYARKNMSKWLSVDSNATSKDSKKRLKALESVCTQIDRGLARAELCGFDASSSGLTACLGIVQSNKLCLASIGNCKAVLGRAHSDGSSSSLRAVLLTSQDDTDAHSRASSETDKTHTGRGMRPMKSMPAPLASDMLSSDRLSEGLLGRGPLGDRPSARPLMTVHQLTRRDQFLVMGTSGLWEVMSPQEAVDFVHQCRQCRPANLSCSAALTLEAHTRWKLKFAKVIAEDVAAVILHFGPMSAPAQPGHRLPAFPDAATTNHDANDDHTLHETREFWSRLQPESLVPLLQSASSKGKGLMPTSYRPPDSPLASRAKGHSPSLHLPIARPSPSLSFQSPPSQSDPGAGGSGDSGPGDSSLVHCHSNASSQPEGSGHSSSSARNASVGSRSVHFSLPLEAGTSDEEDGHGRSRDTESGCDSQHSSRGKEVLDSAQPNGDLPSQAKLKKQSPPLDISFRPDTPDVASALTPRIVSSSGRSSSLSSESPEEPTKAASLPNSMHGSQKPPTTPKANHTPNPFAATAMTPAGSDSDSSDEFESLSTPRSSFDGQEARSSSARSSSVRARSKRPAKAVPKSPKSPSRAYAQQPLDESEGGKSLLAKLSMMERTHSAPGGVPFGMLLEFPGTSRLRSRLPVSIPEDRPVPAAAPSVQDDDSVTRPFRKIYPHGSGDLDTLLADSAENAPQVSRQPDSSSIPRSCTYSALSEGRVHSKAYPSSGQLLSHADLTRVEFPRPHASVTSAPEQADRRVEGRISGGVPRVSSHPENLAEMAAAVAAKESPFARIPLQMVSPQLFSVAPSPPSPFNGFLATLANATSYSTASSSSSIDPWASPSQSGGPLLSKSKRNLDSALGNRSRNSSAAFEELARLRSVHVSNDNAAHEQVPVNSSM